MFRVVKTNFETKLLFWVFFNNLLLTKPQKVKFSSISLQAFESYEIVISIGFVLIKVKSQYIFQIKIRSSYVFQNIEIINEE